jgi:glucosamine-6-phosphate deaminase
MKIETVEDYEGLSRRAAALFMDQAKGKPESVCVLPTGRTPEGLFRVLIEAHHAGDADFSRLRFVVLDEYTGIAADDRRSLHQWLRRALLDGLGISPSRIAAFDPSAADIDAECARVERVIAEWGGIDLAIVGLGPNGHVGFNEPGSAPDSRTRRISLTEESVTSNAGYWGSAADVPRHALTLGIGTLREARKIILMVSGQAKAGILARALEGPVSPDVPASLLRNHTDFTVVADRAALSALGE